MVRENCLSVLNFLLLDYFLIWISTKIMFIMNWGNFIAFPAMGSSVKSSAEVNSKFICPFIFTNPIRCSHCLFFIFLVTIWCNSAHFLFVFFLIDFFFLIIVCYNFMYYSSNCRIKDWDLINSLLNVLWALICLQADWCCVLIVVFSSAAKGRQEEWTFVFHFTKNCVIGKILLLLTQRELWPGKSRAKRKQKM